MRRFLTILACCLAGAVFLIGCDGAATAPNTRATSTLPIPPIPPSPSGIPTNIPALYSPSINITRADYNQAVALWQSQGITEYEMTVNELSLRSNNDYPEIFRVKGDEVTVLYSTGIPTPITMSRSELEPVITDNTVEGLFETVADALSYAEQATNEGFQTVYDVRFDPTFGYVSYFMTACEERRTPQPGVSGYACPSDTSFRVQTSDFKVLSRSTPPNIATPTVQPKSASESQLGHRVLQLTVRSNIILDS